MHGEKNDRGGAIKAPPPPNGIRVKAKWGPTQVITKCPLHSESIVRFPNVPISAYDMNDFFSSDIQ